MRVRIGQLSRKTLLGLLPLTFLLLLLPARLQNSIRFGLGAPLVPVQRLLERVLRSASHSFGYTLFRKGGTSSRHDLDMEVVRLRSLVLKLESELLATKRTIRAVGRDRRNVRYPTIIAQVIGGDPTSWRKSWLLDRGSADGVREGMPAVWGGLAVGRICAAGRFQSSLLLLSDPDSRVAVKSARSGAHGILAGTGGGVCRLKYLSYRQDLKKGDLIVTSGLDGVFPPEYIVGKCIRVSADTGGPFLRAEVGFAFSPGRLEGVTVIGIEPIGAISEDVSDEK